MSFTDYSISGIENSFEKMYTSHFRGMYSYAYTFLKDEVHAEEIVQSVFLKIWEKKDSLQVKQSIKSYLYRMVHNDCMNMLQHESVKAKYIKEKSYVMKNENESTGKKMQAAELEEKFSIALRELPEQCRTIFQLSRFEDMKYREIAHHLGIAEKTVENQMGKALKILRLRLADFLVLVITIVTLFKKI